MVSKIIRNILVDMKNINKLGGIKKKNEEETCEF